MAGYFPEYFLVGFVLSIQFPKYFPMRDSLSVTFPRFLQVVLSLCFFFSSQWRF
jgi:hypothetical protein